MNRESSARTILKIYPDKFLISSLVFLKLIQHIQFESPCNRNGFSTSNACFNLILNLNCIYFIYHLTFVLIVMYEEIYNQIVSISYNYSKFRIVLTFTFIGINKLNGVSQGYVCIVKIGVHSEAFQNLHFCLSNIDSVAQSHLINHDKSHFTVYNFNKKYYCVSK